MNERIQTLLSHQLKEWCGDFNDSFSEELEKFAHAIILDCTKCCDDLERTNQYYISKYGLDPDIRPKQCIEVIKQHFGIAK